LNKCHILKIIEKYLSKIVAILNKCAKVQKKDEKRKRKHKNIMFKLIKIDLNTM